MAPHRLPWRLVAATHKPALAVQIGECVFDRVEVGTVGRQVKQASASALDQFAHARTFVAGRIVHNHEVAVAEFRNQNSRDPGLEDLSIPGQSMTMGAAIPSSRKPALNVLVFQ